MLLTEKNEPNFVPDSPYLSILIMADYQKLLIEIEEKNKDFQKSLETRNIGAEYDDDAYVQQELEIYQKYLIGGKKKALERPEGLRLSNKDVEDNIKLTQLVNSLKTDEPWIQTMAHTSLEDLKIVDWDNAIEREMSFYEDTLKSVTLSMPKLEKMGIPTVRPNDYFAEMVKSDEHMSKIKNRLLKNKEIIRSRIQKRKDSEYKSKSKVLQAEAIKQKIQKRKEVIEAVEQWKKMNKNSNSTFDIQEAEKLYQTSKNLSKDKVKDLYKQSGLKKPNKTSRPGKSQRQKGKR